MTTPDNIRSLPVQNLLDLVVPGRPENPNPEHYYLVFRDPKSLHLCAELAHGSSPIVACDLIIGHLDMGPLDSSAPWAASKCESALTVALVARGYKPVYAGDTKTCTLQSKVKTASFPDHILKRVFSKYGQGYSLRYVRCFVTDAEPVRMLFESTFGMRLAAFDSDTLIGKQVLKALLNAR